ncbi:hypothetical protein NXX91_20585 [Bacteroides thetaiotaomicron]|nr:hypothetical protein [Bacteroides thetaiotaomicron]
MIFLLPIHGLSYLLSSKASSGKIEAVGTPLKDWDIQINYGIKTGYNDAFIIDTEKREAILANCQTGRRTQKERLNLYDRFCVAEILGDTGINGLNYGLSTFIMV